MFDEYSKKTGENVMIRKIDTDDISETFKPLSNLKVVKSDKIKLSEFRSKYKEYGTDYDTVVKRLDANMKSNLCLS